MPPPPAGFQPPILWGTEERWQELVGALGVELEFRRERLVLADASIDEYLTGFEANFGPLVTARATLGDAAFAAVHDDLVTLLGEFNAASDGGLSAEAEYLVAIGRR
jgi:hypothetical protein